MSSFYKLSIKEVRRETPSTVSVAFTIPLEFQDFYKFTAGQYVTLKLTLDGEEIRRAYSICSSPNSGELRVAIKAVPNGKFSQFANKQLQAGHVLDVSVPEGKFIFEPKDKQRSIALFAAGSGITPILSIAKSVLEDESNSTVLLVYGNKSVEETIFHQEIQDLQQKYMGRLIVEYAFTAKPTSDSYFGRIDKSIVNNVLFNKHNEITFDKFYVCGPEEMINTVSNTLKEHNVLEKDIKFELFTTSSSSGKEIETGNGHTKIKVICDGDEQEFEMSQKQTVLEAALKQGIDVPYSCQGGVCSSCICRVTEGKAEMKKNQILTDSEIEEGLILSCQAIPTTTSMTVDFDDI